MPRALTTARPTAAALRFATLVVTFTFLLATAIGTTGLVARHGAVAFGASTTLTVVAGEVQVRRDAAADYSSARDGEVLAAGMSVRTGAASYAVLTYFEGSTVSIEPQTEMVITALLANPDGTTIIEMQQQLGRTWHAVNRLLRVGSRYEVRTPTAVASVRGTAFQVDVDADDAGEVVSRIATTEGKVATSKLPTPSDPTPAEVLVTAGTQTRVRAAEPVPQPEPIPAPERKVTVTLGATDGVVLDSLGRANGFADGKVVLQTPGATVELANGTLVVTLPDPSDGKIVAVIERSTRPEVGVKTEVDQRGASAVVVTEVMQAPVLRAVGGVELSRTESGTAVRGISEEEKDAASDPKVPSRAAEAPAPQANISPTVAAIFSQSLPRISGQDAASQAEQAARAAREAARQEGQRIEELRKAEQTAAVAEELRKAETRLEEARLREAERKLEAVRRQEEQLKQEAARVNEESRRAEEKRLEEQRQAEEQAKQESERRLQSLQARAPEPTPEPSGAPEPTREPGRPEEPVQVSGFVPRETLPPLPATKKSK